MKRYFLLISTLFCAAIFWAQSHDADAAKKVGEGEINRQQEFFDPTRKVNKLKENYSFSIDYHFTDQAKTSMLRQLDVHTRSRVSKLNARDLSDNTCTFISKYLDPQIYSAWTVTYTPGKLSSDSLSIGKRKPQNNGTIACNIYDFVGGKLTLNLTTSGGNSDHFQYGSWHSFDDTMVVDKDCVAPVFATH